MDNKTLRRINREFRQSDDSSLWPINGRFSVADRAIRRAYEFRREYGAMSAEEYRALLDSIASDIVNNPSNFPSAYGPHGSMTIAARWNR